MKKKHIEIVGFQALKTAFYGFENMFLRKIKLSLPYSAFGLQDYLFTDGAVHMNCIGKSCFTFPAAVNICMIKKISASVKSCLYKTLRFRRRNSIDTHTADCNDRYLKI